ncbi:Bug family tripartite tricarboxylate transporter substrate binding protein [Solicola sp. PLA-1-18]|uniref:Bug family tripartite tricarboxylate transporter substrate binding protein n=1 Tax=Solicola sp. PLA-1-18 TaxID=3380532 RepID=UPI003B77878B
MRRLSLTAAGAAVTIALATAGCAQTGATGADSDFPSKPIELLVGYDAGGPTDVGARLLAEELEKKLDATITVVNRPGASSQIAYTALTSAEPDGYTMGAVTFPSAIITVIDPKRGADYDRDSFDPVALNVVDPTAVAVAADSDIDTPEDLIAAAKASPKELRAATTGVASNEHFALARLQEESGASLAPVHFADGATAAATAFLGGNVEVLLANVSDMQTLVTEKNAKIIGVMAAERSPFLPDVPTFEESGADVEISSSRGLAFPAGTPDEITTKVSTAVGEILEDDAFRTRMEDQGLAPQYMDSKAYAEYWDETTALFTDLLPLVSSER